MILHRSSIRYLARHPWQLGLSILGVALGVAVVVAIDLAVESSREAFRVSTETVAGRATHRIVGGPAGLPDTLSAGIRIATGARQVAPVVEGWVTIEGAPGRAFRLLGVDPLSEIPFRPFLGRVGRERAAGPAPASLIRGFLDAGSRVVLARETAAELGLRPGDTLRLTVAGATSPVVLHGTLSPTGSLDREAVRDLLFTDISTAQELTGSFGRVDHVDLRIPDGPTGEELLGEIRDLLPPEAALDPVGARTERFLGMIGAFDLNLTALSFLALVFGLFLIYNTATFSVVQRRELLGILRALGVTRARITGSLLAEAAAVGAVGTVLGLGLGVILGRGLVDLVTRTVNDLYFAVTVRSLSIPAAVLLKGGVMGVGGTLLASLPAAREASGASPRTALARSSLEERARSLVPRVAAAGGTFVLLGFLLLVVPGGVRLGFAGLFGVLFGMALLAPGATVLLVAAIRRPLTRVFGVLGGMAARGVVTALSRTGPAIASLVVAVAVTVGLGIMITSFRSTLSDWLDSTLRADVYVSLPGGASSRPEGTLDPEQVARLQAVEGVAGWSTYRSFRLESAHGPADFVALELDPRGEDAFSFAEGGGSDAFRRFRSGAGVLVSEPFAFRNDLSVGDTISLPTESGPRAFGVAGVFYDYGSDQGVVMMSRRAYDESFSDPGITSLGLFAEEGTDAGILTRRARAALGPGQELLVQSNRSLRAASLEVFDRTFAITAVLRLLALLVAFIGIMGALMALQLERTRELGVLRAGGLTPGQLWKLVTAQTGLMGLTAGLLSIPMGIVLAVVMIFVVNRRSFGWTLEMRVDAGVLLQAVGLAVAGALLAGLYPAWRMSRTPPAEALREIG